jgi:hypothetical protein
LYVIRLVFQKTMVPRDQLELALYAKRPQLSKMTRLFWQISPLQPKCVLYCPDYTGVV